jgi:GntR family transcriptional regulator of arabinose operon
MEHTKSKALYQIIVDDLIEKIQNNEFSYDKPLCTEKSLSAEYEVSRITAKRAIEELEKSGILYRKRGIGSFVSQTASLGQGTSLSKEKEPPLSSQSQGEELSENSASPHETLLRHGLSSHTQQKTDRKLKIIALVVPFSISQGGILTAVEAASRLLFHSEYCLTFHVYEPEEEIAKALLMELYEREIDGIVYYPFKNKIYAEVLQLFTSEHKPVIILDKVCSYQQFSTVVCDNYSGAYQLTEHLIAYGHTNIAYLSRFPKDEVSSISERYQGFSDCMQKNGVKINPKFVNTSLTDNYHLLKHVIGSLFKAGVTAIECENDEVAFNVYMCCRSLSIQVPEQMNITGFDNIDWATTGSAQITTVDQNFEKIGTEFAKIILQPELPPAVHKIPVELIPRSSTGPKKQIARR